MHIEACFFLRNHCHSIFKSTTEASLKKHMEIERHQTCRPFTTSTTHLSWLGLNEKDDDTRDLQSKTYSRPPIYAREKKWRWDVNALSVWCRRMSDCFAQTREEGSRGDWNRFGRLRGRAGSGKLSHLRKRVFMKYGYGWASFARQILWLEAEFFCRCEKGS